MAYYIKTDDLMGKVKKVSYAKLRSLWMSSNKLQSQYTDMLLKAYAQRDKELLDTLNKCIQNEKQNVDMLRTWVDKRFDD